MTKSKVIPILITFALLLTIGITLLEIGPQNDAASIASARKAGV